MSTSRMLIDSSHPEETRVVVVRGSRIEEFDFESQHKKQLRGNIYLAKVTRVEPSLQAAFIEYGGNRHGFLAFSEIHPDYYQIPVADRQALLAAEAEDDEDDEDDEREKRTRSKRRKDGKPAKAAEAAAATVSESPEAGDGEAAENGEPEDENGDGVPHDDVVESVGSEDAMEEVPDRRHVARRQYKIQEVIKRRQILLVQVVKEERGNKGAALTTYLSLAGRYCVLMPNTARGGGISRKITSVQDRKRLKDVVKELDVPKGMGVILRTAGAMRTKAEVKRDYEYLLRLWDNVRNLTLESTAPALVYEEGSLIKRSIRDLYNKDIAEVLVSGDEGYKEAKGFMRMLMPSHAKVVQPYREETPIFARNGIESQLDKLLQQQVTLKSGGYIIINQTEALVAIDVNSGKSTREHSIESTALQTNLEAAEEVARQLRLRDLAGLIVIDFIDMEEKRNNRAVEKKLKDCLKSDRARIQVGRISHFGLLEMSRQRIRASVLESTMQVCPHCNGVGFVRSPSSIALHVIRAIEDYLLRNPAHHITVRTSPATALYVLNQKRQTLVDMERRFGLYITMAADEDIGAQMFAIDRGEVSELPKPDSVPLPALVEEPDEPLIDEIVDDEAESEEAGRSDAASGGREENGGDDDARRKRRRRRRRGKGRERDEGVAAARPVASNADLAADDQDEDGDEDDEAREGSPQPDGEGDSRRGRRRRRGRRSGRKHREHDGDALVLAAEPVAFDLLPEPVPAESTEPVVVQAETVEPSAPAAEDVIAEEKPAKKRRSRRKADVEKDAQIAADAEEAKAPEPEPAMPEPPALPAADNDDGPSAEVTGGETMPEREMAEADAGDGRPSRTRRNAVEAIATQPVVTSATADADKPKKAGWWSRRGFF